MEPASARAVRREDAGLKEKRDFIGSVVGKKVRRVAGGRCSGVKFAGAGLGHFSTSGGTVSPLPKSPINPNGLILSATPPPRPKGHPTRGRLSF